MTLDPKAVTQQAVQRLDTYLERGPRRRLLSRIAHGMARHHAGRVASAMAFNLFLAAIPMLAVAGWLLTVVLHRSPDTLGAASSLLEATPTDVREIFDRHIGRFSVDAVAPVAVLGSLWLASGAFHTLMTVFETELDADRRAWVKKRMISVLCVLIAVFALGLSVPVVVTVAGVPALYIEQLTGISAVRVVYGRYVTAAVGFGTLVVLFGGFYRIALRRSGVARRVWPGALLTVALGGLASSALGFYGREIGRFTLYYGGLATVAVLLAWLWLWCASILLGAELNTQLEDDTVGRRTTSDERPRD